MHVGNVTDPWNTYIDATGTPSIQMTTTKGIIKLIYGVNQHFFPITVDTWPVSNASTPSIGPFLGLHLGKANSELWLQP